MGAGAARRGAGDSASAWATYPHYSAERDEVYVLRLKVDAGQPAPERS